MPRDDDPPPRKLKPSGKLDGATWNQTTGANRLPPGPPRSAGRQSRIKRNLVIALAYKGGASVRLLSEVFGMCRAGLTEILADVRAQPTPAWLQRRMIGRESEGGRECRA